MIMYFITVFACVHRIQLETFNIVLENILLREYPNNEGISGQLFFYQFLKSNQRSPNQSYMAKNIYVSINFNLFNQLFLTAAPWQIQVLLIAPNMMQQLVHLKEFIFLPHQKKKKKHLKMRQQIQQIYSTDTASFSSVNHVLYPTTPTQI